MGSVRWRDENSRAKVQNVRADSTAKNNNLSRADMCRVAVNWLAAVIDEDGCPPFVFGGVIFVWEKPDPDPKEFIRRNSNPV
jgi:hypothetical protein